MESGPPELPNQESNPSHVLSRRCTMVSLVSAWWARNLLALVALFTMNAAAVRGQEPTSTSPEYKTEALERRLQNLQKQMSEMQSMMAAMHADLLRSRAEASELRRELEASGGLPAARHPAENVSGPKSEAVLPATVASSQAGTGNEQRVQKLEEEQQLSNARLEEQNQTKVESASKYRVRLSGAAILNLISNTGLVDNLDFPSLVPADRPSDPKGSFGASLRQSLLGLEVFGPEIKGARVSADLQFDFAGGFPSAPDGVTLGLARLRTGVVRIAGQRTTLVAGQDAPFLSPLSPSSIASLAVPAFAYAGNLWTWTPQIRVEHRVILTENSGFLLQGGLLDPLTGEPPNSLYLRAPNAGEASRQPAYAARTAWSYRLFHATGGWAQLKFRQTEKLEWNGAFGQDSSFARDLRLFPLSTQSYVDPSLARNRSAFLNFIYRPRSDLLFSAEYRRLRTISVSGNSEKAGHINVSMGVLF